MKNIFKKISLVLLAALIAVSSVSCGQQTNNSSTSEDIKEETTFNGVHQYDYTERNDYLVKDGRTDYKLVCDIKSSQIMKIASEEFQYFFKLATDIDIPVIKDAEGMKHEANNKYIVIGENELFKSSGINLDKKVLKSNGVRVVTKDNSIYLFGGTDRASLYAVYTFFEQTFNLKVFNRETYLIDKGVEDKKVYDYNIIDLPDIEMRCGDRAVFAEVTRDSSRYSSRMKMDASEGTYLLPVHEEFDIKSISKGTGHNSRLYLPRKTYNDPDKKELYHPKWFADQGTQLCYTAHGDEKEFDLMVEECAKKIEFSLKNYTPKEYPYYRAVHIGLEDAQSACACEKCSALAKHYGVDSGAKVVFCNALCKKVRDWMNAPENAEYKREDFKIIFFAYAAFEGAPAKWNEEENKYVPIDDAVKFDDMLGVYYVPATFVEYKKGIDDPINNMFKQNTQKWSDLTNTIYLWCYDANFRTYMYMYDTFNFYSDGYGYFAKNKVVNIMRQGNSDDNCTNVTAWAMLKAYLFAKLTWNTNLDAKELIDEYFDAVYKDASPVMKRIFNENRLFIAHIMTENDMYKLNSSAEKIAYSKYWPISTIKNWIKEYDEAYAKIEKYKEADPELYNILYRNITLEWISPVYMLFDLYKDVLNENEYNTLLTRFKKDYQLVAPIYTTEHGGAKVDDFLETL